MIGMVKQDSPTQIKVYDERGVFIFNREGILVGYTQDTLAIKDVQSDTIRVYDSKGTFKYNR